MTLRGNIFGGSGIFRSAIFGGAGGAPVVPWYLSGGIAAANCIAAYTPKGAASLAASYDNNAAPANGLPDGTYDAAPGVAPTWNVVTGWTYAGGQYLTTGIVPAGTHTTIVRFANCITSGGYLFGSFLVAGTVIYGVCPFYTGVGPGVQYWNQPSVPAAILPNMSDGVLAIAGAAGFRGGAPDAVLGGTGNTGLAMFIGALNMGGVAAVQLVGDILAVAHYDITITDAQVLAVSTAAAAL